MTKEIRAYMAVLEQFFSVGHSDGELLKFRAELLKRIEFYQHERLIHLIVTMLMSLMMCTANPQVGLMLLAVLFLVMTIAYIKHYYFLENSVQRMYKFYYRIENL